jgi:AAA+ ATPase superfamily predicted ATPase
MDILRSEHLSSVAEAAAVIEAIALGETRFGSIASRTNLTGPRLTYVINELVALDMVGREVRFGDREGSKYSRYWIADPFIGFWFRFVRPNRAVLSGANGPEVWSRRMAPHLNDWMGPVFERVVAQALRRGDGAQGVGLVDALGSYWSRDGQTEIAWVARTEAALVFVECKWRATRPVGLDAFLQLREHAARYPRESAPRRYCLASVTGFSEELLALEGEDLVLLGPDAF